MSAASGLASSSARASLSSWASAASTLHESAAIAAKARSVCFDNASSGALACVARFVAIMAPPLTRNVLPPVHIGQRTIAPTIEKSGQMHSNTIIGHTFERIGCDYLIWIKGAFY